MADGKMVFWVVMHENGALCERCRGWEHIPLPMSVTAFVRWGEYIQEKHRHCGENPPGGDHCPA